MAITVYCDILSDEKKIFTGLLEMLIATSSLGDLGIAPGHTPLLTDLNPGPIRLITRCGQEEILYVSGGFLEVQPNQITVLADTALRAYEINEFAAIEAKKLAEQKLKKLNSEFDYSRATIQLAEATAKLRTLQAIRKKHGQ